MRFVKKTKNAVNPVETGEKSRAEMERFGNFTYICTPFWLRNYEKTTVKLLKLKDKSFKDANYSTVSEKRSSSHGG